jgi:hypothetical protein
MQQYKESQGHGKDLFVFWHVARSSNALCRFRLLNIRCTVQRARLIPVAVRLVFFTTFVFFFPIVLFFLLQSNHFKDTNSYTPSSGSKCKIFLSRAIHVSLRTSSN